MQKRKKILITAATDLELSELKDICCDIDFANTGIGIAKTVFNTTKLLTKNRYDLVINTGICGSYNQNFNLGEVVEVIKDSFTDQIVEDGTTDLLWKDAGLADNINHPYNIDAELLPNLKTSSFNIRKVVGVTSDTIHASDTSIKRIERLFSPDIETMEGAAVFFVCNSMEINVIQIRGISNHVGIRDKAKWRVKEAIKNYSFAIKQILEELVIPNFSSLSSKSDI